MEEGELVEWLVKAGDKVSKGDIVAVVETQKGAIEIEIFEAGEIGALLEEPGQTLPVGAPLARLGAAGDDDISAAPVGARVAAPAAPAPEPAPKLPAEQVVPVAGAPAPAATAGGTVLASPAARASAAELGTALEAVTGSGHSGAILLSDVERHVPAHETAIVEPAPEERPKGKPGLHMIEMLRAIAAAMSRSKREIPHYYLSHDIDMQAAQDWLTALNADRIPDRRLLLGAMPIRATVRALAKVPELNNRFEAEHYAPSVSVRYGLAVAMRGGV